MSERTAVGEILDEVHAAAAETQAWRQSEILKSLTRAGGLLQWAADHEPDPARAVVLRRAAANIAVEIERIK